MMHTQRKWCVTEVASAEELARMLTEMTWGCCNGFHIRGHPGYVWLNDSTSPDGTQEYAAIKLKGLNNKPMQIESISFSWCYADLAQVYIEKTLFGGDDTNTWLGHNLNLTLQIPQEHERCQYCA